MGWECGRPVVVPILPENDREAGQIVTAAIVALLQVSSSHQAPAAASPWVSAHSATSAFIFLFFGGQVEGEVVGWGSKAFYSFIYLLQFTVFLLCIHKERQMMLTEAGDWWDTSSFIPSVNRGSWSADFRCDSDSQALGQEVGLEYKSHFSENMSAQTFHFASSLNFIIQKPFIRNEGD